MEMSLPAELGDEELVVLAQEGRRNAFEALVERYQRKAYRAAFNFTRDREEAKDLSQEAFLRAYLHLKSFDRRAGFYTWFYRILINLCLDHRRRAGRASLEPLDEQAAGVARAREADGDSSAPDRNIATLEWSRKVMAALNALPVKQRTAFILRNHEDLPIREIAKVMQTAEGTVKAHLHRAAAALRRNLAGWIEERES